MPAKAPDLTDILARNALPVTDQVGVSSINHQHTSSLSSTSPSPFLWAGFGGPGR